MSRITSNFKLGEDSNPICVATIQELATISADTKEAVEKLSRGAYFTHEEIVKLKGFGIREGVFTNDNGKDYPFSNVVMVFEDGRDYPVSALERLKVDFSESTAKTVAKPMNAVNKSNADSFVGKTLKVVRTDYIGRTAWGKPQAMSDVAFVPTA